MARRKSRLPLRIPKHTQRRLEHEPWPTTTIHPPCQQAAKLVHPLTNTTLGHPRVLKAHVKHLHDLPITPPASSPSTLGDRLHALPPELRAHIFRLLLVRPAKWDLLHHPSCPLITSPLLNIHPVPDSTWDCVRCRSSSNVALWRNRHRPTWAHRIPICGTWVDPWRSAWAPTQRNEFLCTGCYDTYFRPRPFPECHEELRCLCARRRDLGTLLVCRSWYREAGAVFYRENTFAFETIEAFRGWMENLRAEWCGVVGRVSIVMAAPLPDEGGRQNGEALPVVSNKSTTVGTLLRRLPSLHYLELDALLLTNPVVALHLLGAGLLQNLRIRFLLRRPARFTPTSGSVVEVFPALAHRHVLRGGLPEEVARAMKGQQGLWLKSGRGRKEVLKEAVALFVQEVVKLWARGDEVWGNESGVEVEDMDDMVVWERLWFRVGGLQHWAFLPVEREGRV